MHAGCPPKEGQRGEVMTLGGLTHWRVRCNELEMSRHLPALDIGHNPQRGAVINYFGGYDLRGCRHDGFEDIVVEFWAFNRYGQPNSYHAAIPGGAPLGPEIQ